MFEGDNQIYKFGIFNGFSFDSSYLIDGESDQIRASSVPK